MKKKTIIAFTIVILTAAVWASCTATITEEIVADWIETPDFCARFLGYLPGLPFTFRLPESVGTAEVSSSDLGTFYLTDDSGSEALYTDAVGDNSHRICWSPDNGGMSYVEIRFLKGGRICGYAVISVNADDYLTATVLKCVKFTDGAGNLTTLSASEVENRIGKVKDEHAGQ